MKIIITEKQLKLLKESKDESILLVGDSHTVDAGFTWSSLMKKNFDNVKIIAIGGKRTSWMKEQLQNELKNKKYDKVIIWGGNNDTFSLTPNSQAISNIQQMVDMVNAQGGKAFVIQGYDYEIFADPEKYKPTKYANIEDMKKFRKKYIDFQNDLASSISGAVIIPKFKVENSHASDNIHGDSFAHQVVLNDVSKYINRNISNDLVDTEIEKGDKILSDLENLKNEVQNLEDSTKAISKVQSAFKFLGFLTPDFKSNGILDSETLQSIKDFQGWVDLSPTGTFGYEEFQNLIKQLEKRNFKNFDFSNLLKPNQVDNEFGQNLVIKNPGVDVINFPNNLMEKFQKIAGDDYDEFISGCNSIGLNPETAVRQLFTESGFSPDVINCSRKSSAGALGIAQFMPGTWKSYGNGSPCNVSDSLKAYIKLMGDNLKRFPNRPDLAVAAYNSGPNLKAYNNALNNELDFTDLKGKIPNESYKYSASIFQA